MSPNCPLPPARRIGRDHGARATGRAVLLAGVTTLLLAGACQSTTRIDYERELQVLRETIAGQQDQLTAQRATIDTLTEQLDTVRAIKSEDLAKIFHPVTLEIDRHSGGYDADGQPGDDGVVVYLRPRDAEGDVLKVAGEIRIQLYDLAAPPRENLIGEYVIPVEQARELWHGKLLTNHYTIRCPWPHGPPRHSTITINATFIDYLTQRVLSAQRTCEVRLPP
jgi:hypothetical protein